MTVCAAAICMARFGEDSKPQPVVVGLSDLMLTTGELEFEPRTPKIYPLPLKRVEDKKLLAMMACLSADDSDLGYDLAVQTYQAARDDPRDLTVRDVAYLYGQKFVAMRREHAEAMHLKPFNLDYDSFIARQRTMRPEFVVDRADRVEQEQLKVESLIVGVDRSGAHIYHVFDPGIVVCRDRSAFWAIGVGKRQFESQFMALGYDALWHLHKTVLLMYSAKKNAERASGVGKHTNMFMISADGFSPSKENSLRAIDEHYKDFEKNVEAARENAAQQILEDIRVWNPPETDSQVPVSEQLGINQGQ